MFAVAQSSMEPLKCLLAMLPSTKLCVLTQHPTRSLVNKLSLFQSFVYYSHPSVCAITETWLSKDILNNEILPSGYSIFRRDRDSRGGGVMLACTDSLPTSLLSLPTTPSHLELISIRIDVPSNPFIICVLYIPPSASDSYFAALVLNTRPTCDFNCPDIDWALLSATSLKSNELCDLLFDNATD